MVARSTRLVWALACVWGSSTACGTPAGEGPRETGDEAPSEASSDASTSSTTGAPTCIPGDERCAGDAIERCDPTGRVWEMIACPRYAACTPCSTSGADTCTPGASVRCAGPCDPDPERPASAGCSFVTTWLDWGRIDAPEPESVVVFNPDAQRVASVIVSRVPNGAREEEMEAPVAIEPGESLSIELEAPPFVTDSSLLRTGAVLRLRSDLPVVVHQVAHPQDTGTIQSWLGAATLLLPEFSFRGDFLVPSARARSDQLVGEAYFVVVALEDDTEVTWTPKVETEGNGAPIPPLGPGETGTVRLNRYDQIRVSSALALDPFERDLSGARVLVSKAAAVFSGVPCAQPQAESRSCDPVWEQLIPMQYWGRRSVVPPPRPRSVGAREEGLHVRIFAGEPGVTVQELGESGEGPWNFDEAGDMVSVRFAPGRGAVFEGDGAFSVVQYLETQRFNGVEDLRDGDTAMVQIAPVEQWLNRYGLVTDDRWSTGHLSIARARNGAEVRISGVAIGGWQAIGDFEWAHLELPILGVEYQLESDAPFGVQFFEYGSAGIPAGDPELQDAAAARSLGVAVVELVVP